MHKIYFKNKKYRLKNRHALANVVTSAIILSAVSIMGVMMLQWSNSSLTTQKQAIEETFSTQTNKINEDLIFDNVWFSSTCPGKCINVTMSNVGTLGLNVTQIDLINGTTLANLKYFYYTNGGIVTSGSLSKNATYSWRSGGDYDITVHTERGNQFTTSVIAP
jgi:archaellum component FlaF (FlaF/FlaG flagellin family)